MQIFWNYVILSFYMQGKTCCLNFYQNYNIIRIPDKELFSETSPSGAPFHALSKLCNATVGFVNLPH